jgi:autotransporter-associated beta strand protein
MIMSSRWTIRRTCRALTILLAICQTLALICTPATPAYAQHVLGIDTSFTAWTQTQWNTLFGEGYRFAIPRAGHGLGADAGFYSNISRATNAGLLVGSYHFITPAADTATDEANFYLNTAGMYMKPGYLLPVCDLESGNTSLDTPTMRDWVNLFNDTIFNAKGVRPIVYASSSYAGDEVDAQVAWFNYSTTPKSSVRTYQWLARPIGSSGETLASGNPPAAAGYPNPYGVWDPNYITKTNSRDPAINPWVFWQNTGSTIDPSGINVDYNAVNGNMEFLKDFLVPALWTNAGSGDWSTLDANGRAAGNWNSGNLGWVSGNAATGPAPRLPNSLDWVKLQATGTVTLSSGAQSVRKFYTQQPLNITGGSLSVDYVPGSGGQFDLPSEFNAAVTLSSGASYSAHTTQIDSGGGQFNINGGTITFTEIQLASHASNSGKIVMGGDPTFAQTGGAGTSVIRSTGSLAQAGSISLAAGNRTFTVNNGSAGVDLNVRVAISGTGRLIKSGAGTLQLSTTDSYSGGTTITSGVLQIAGDDRLGAVPGSSQPTNIILDGGTLKTGAQINSVSLTNAGANYTAFPTLSVNGAGPDSMAASVNILAGIRTIGVTAGGSGYVNQTPSSPPTNGSSGTFVDIVGGGGSGATAYATVSGGVVTSITIANQGSGYTSMPSVFISGTGSTAGSGATASATGITLQNLALNDGGFDYTTPTISISGGSGSGATASATASSSSITLNSNRGISLTANGGTLYQTAGTTLTVGGIISSTANGTLTKSGTGTLLLSGANTYTGATTVNAGALTVSGATASLGSGNVTVLGTAGTSLVIQSGVTNAINNGATLSLLGGGVLGLADYGFANLGTGINEGIDSLNLGGTPQANGLTYGSMVSGALIQSAEYFTGTGILSVGLLGDFNNDNSVDAADYVVWQKSPSTFGGSPGYDLWRANFGNTSPGAGSSLDGGTVPEPSSLVSLMLGVAALAGRRRGH